jgi:hypothetical protein
MSSDPDDRRLAQQRPKPPADEPELPEVTRDERRVGWGEDDAQRSDEWYLRERPPHHE